MRVFKGFDLNSETLATCFSLFGRRAHLICKLRYTFGRIHGALGRMVERKKLDEEAAEQVVIVMLT
ncbi:MAG: hypothetical protein KAW09_09470, partial [Thermoplasmata archaeon]|nr:hypothetical protein [Thermoplasmata archaeon]